MARDGFIENHIPGEEEFAVEITYQSAESILDISNEDGLEMACSASSADLFRLMNKALATEYS